jgi:hypothetical protein
MLRARNRFSVRPLLIAAAIAALSAVPGLPGADGGTAWAEADSDVAIDASLTLQFDDRGNLAAIRERWAFGYDYSVAMRGAVDPDRDGVVDARELAIALSDPLSWMARLDYFTRISDGGRHAGHAAAEDVAVTFPGGRMVVDFTLPLLAPPRFAVQSIEVSDPDLFYEIHYGSPDVVSEGAPDYCTITRQSVTGSEIAIDVRCR